MAYSQMSSKAFELSFVHTDVQCNGCDQASIHGLRYACLVCEDYDECGQCRLNKRSSRKHRAYHPVQTILPPDEFARSMECVPSQGEVRIYCCPHCGDEDFNVRGLTEHCQRYHPDGERGHKVRCPICVTFRVPYRRKFRLEDCTLLRHLLEDHRDVESAAVQASHEGDCAICMDDVTLSANRKNLRCGHAFHGNCIGRWLQTNTSCPVCRAEVNTFFMM